MKSFLLKLLFVVAITTLVWFSWTTAIIAICATVLASLHNKASSLIEISFGPLKAKLEREISDAEKLVEKLKTVAAIQAKAAITASVYTGRFASGDDWIFRSAKRIEQALRELDISEEILKDTLSDLVRITLLDAGNAATGGGYGPMHLPEAARNEWAMSRKAKTFADPDKLEAWLTEWDQVTPERKARIDDMRWMLAKGDIKDSEQYMRAHEPVPWPSQ